MGVVRTNERRPGGNSRARKTTTTRPRNNDRPGKSEIFLPFSPGSLSSRPSSAKRIYFFLSLPFVFSTIALHSRCAHFHSSSRRVLRLSSNLLLRAVRRMLEFNRVWIFSFARSIGDTKYRGGISILNLSVSLYLSSRLSADKTLVRARKIDTQRRFFNVHRIKRSRALFTSWYLYFIITYDMESY